MGEGGKKRGITLTECLLARRLDPTDWGGRDRWDVGVRGRSSGGLLSFWLE